MRTSGVFFPRQVQPTTTARMIIAHVAGALDPLERRWPSLGGWSRAKLLFNNQPSTKLRSRGPHPTSPRKRGRVVAHQPLPQHDSSFSEPAAEVAKKASRSSRDR